GGGGYSGKWIYENFSKAGWAEDLHGAGDLVKKLATDHQIEAQAIRDLAVELDTAWQGKAASAAGGAVLPLVVAHEQAIGGYNTGHGQTGSQVDSFGGAKRTVVPVPDVPTKPQGFDGLDSSAKQSYEKAVTANLDASVHNG